MARGRWKLKRDLEREQGQIQGAARKRGLWGSIGGTLLGGLAMAVTGGAASPVVAGLMAGGGKYIGGHLGNLLAGKTSGGKLKGGKFFQGEREALASQIKENIGAKAAKAAVTAGMAKLPGAALKFGKEGFSATVGGAARGAGEVTKAAPLYTAEEGGFGKLIDFRGSYIGKGLGKMQAAGAAREAEALQEGMPSAYGDIDIDKVLQEGKVQRATKLKSAQIDEMLAARDPLPRSFEPSMDEMMERKINMKGPGFQKSDQVFSDPAWRSDVQQEAIRAANKGTQVTERALRTPIDMSEYTPTKIDPYTRGYTGDVPDLMDLYKDELKTPISTSEGIETMGIDRDYWSGGSGAGDMPLDIDQDIYDTVTTPGTPDIAGSSVSDLPGRKNLSVELMERRGQGNITHGVYDADTSRWQGALGPGRITETRADSIGGDTGPYIKRPGDVFRGEDYRQVNKYLQSDAYSQYLTDYNKANPNIPSVPGTPETTRLVQTDTISADMTQFPDKQTLLQQAPGPDPSFYHSRSYPVESPDIAGGFGSLPGYGVQSPDLVKPLGRGTGSRFQRASDLQRSSAWHKRLFKDNDYGI